MQGRKKNKSAAKNFSIGLVGLEFSKRILSKYVFIRRSGKLPSLIFLKLFSNKIETGKIRPYPKSRSIINYFRFHLSFYFGIIRKSMDISGSNPMEHMFYIESVEPHLQLSENELKRDSNSVKKIGSKEYSTASSEQNKILEFLNIQGKRADARYYFISMPGIFPSYGSKSDSLDSYFFPEFSYLIVFRQMMLNMHRRPGKNYGNLLFSRNKEIKDINHFYSPGSDLLDSSYRFSYLMTGPAKIALSPAASGYLQRNRHLENAGSIRYDAASPVVFRKMNKEFSISGSLPGPAKVYSAMDSSDAGKADNLQMNQDRIIQDIRYGHDPDLLDSAYRFSYLITGPAKIALSPAASGYLQMNRNLENAGSIRYNSALPVVFRKMNKELSFSGSLPGPAKVYSAMDSSDAGKTDNLINQNRTVQAIRYEHAPGSNLHDSSYHFSNLMTGPAKIALSPAASGYLQRNRHLENAGSISHNAASPVVFRKMNKELNLNFKNFTGNNTYNPSELVIKKTSLQGTENLTRNPEEKIPSTKSAYHSIKDSIREVPFNEINRIADRVYHIIERKISIEKDRRGLL